MAQLHALVPEPSVEVSLDLPPPIWSALISLLDRWWWSDFEQVGEALTTDDPLDTDVRAQRMTRLRAEAAAQIADDTAGWTPPSPTFADLLARDDN